MGKKRQPVRGVTAPAPRLTRGAALVLALGLALPVGAVLALAELWLF